jgi:hypothetical protein
LIPPWRDGLKSEIRSAANPKPFFAAQIQGEHGGDHDHRHSDEARLEAKRNEFRSAWSLAANLFRLEHEEAAVGPPQYIELRSKQILPALEQCRYAEVTAIASRDLA